jgi:hypothetical protein
MNRRGLSLLVGLGMLFALAQPARADGWIYFQNNVAATITPVFQVTGVKVVAPFVAQLYLLKDDWVAVSQIVRFSSSGRFGGGIVTIPGDYGGKTVMLQVRVWDGSRFATYDEAFHALSGCGISEAFSATLATPPNQPAQPMSNFKSFTLHWDDSPPLLPAPSYRETLEDQPFPHISADGGILPGVPFTPSCGQQRTVGDLFAYNKRPTRPITDYPTGLNLGNLRGVFGTDHQEHGPIDYVPNPKTYGVDVLYFPVCCEFSEGPCGSTAVFITIKPSPARQKPTLLISDTKKPTLLGLNAHRYRIEQSADLNSWEPIGSATGNYTTVDLSPFVSAGTRAQFLRASEITGP